MPATRGMRMGARIPSWFFMSKSAPAGGRLRSVASERGVNARTAFVGMAQKPDAVSHRRTGRQTSWKIAMAVVVVQLKL